MDCLVLIPDRDYRWFLDQGGHQPPSSEQEISIPEWDFGHLAQDLKVLQSYVDYHIRKIVDWFYWSSYSVLRVYVLVWIWWHQSSNTEKAIRCFRCLHPLQRNFL